MHPDQMAQAADQHRAEMERKAREERLARRILKEERDAAKAEARADRAGKGP